MNEYELNLLYPCASIGVLWDYFAFYLAKHLLCASIESVSTRNRSRGVHNFVAEARAMSGRVEALLTSCTEMRELIVETRERLADLQLQVDAFRRQCPSRYQPLCDTVDTGGLDVKLRLDTVRYKANFVTRLMRSQVIKTVKTSKEVFWVVTSCGLVDGYQCFTGTYCLHLKS
jgi:hypothetical protein